MTTINTEFNNEFDILYNNIASDKAPGLDTYEKSVFLTSAQEEIVLSLYSSKTDPIERFENTEEIRRYLDNLIKTTKVTPVNPEDTDVVVSENSKLASLPNDLWFITYESAKLSSSDNPCVNGKEVEVVPITQDYYHRIKNNPFRGSDENRVLRLDYARNKVELVSPYNISNYIVRYVKKLKPIILDNLEESLSINGEHNESGCELHPALYRIIIDRAVKLAIASFSQNLQ